MPLYGACRTIHADVLVAAGRWPDAETGARGRARRARRGTTRRWARRPSRRSRSLRLRQGRLGEADAAPVRAARSTPPSLLALAELRLAEGGPRSPRRCSSAALAAAKGDVLASSRLLVPLVGGCASPSATPRRRAPPRSASPPRRRLRPAARRGAGAARRRARSRSPRAATRRRRESARRRSTASGVSGCRTRPPRRGSRSRVRSPPTATRSPSRTRAPRSPRSASSARRARPTRPPRSCASSAPARRRGSASTASSPRREREVLALLARGMTNAQIGDSLFISTKTAGHHVSRILAKLGARNRAEAAVHAAASARARERIGNPIGRAADVPRPRRAARLDVIAHQGGRDGDHRREPEGGPPRDLGIRRLRRRRARDRLDRAGAPDAARGRPAGDDVLDVATGTGNVALRAAATGARVVGLDLTPELFDAARRRAGPTGASTSTGSRATPRTLPYDDESFDRVLSAFGVQFAPRHDVTARELVARLPPGRLRRALQLDARGPGRRDAVDHRPLHAAAARLREPAAALGRRGPRPRALRRRRRRHRARVRARHDAVAVRLRPTPT